MTEDIDCTGADVSGGAGRGFNTSMSRLLTLPIISTKLNIVQMT